ncbi:hypothetical protein [Rhizobium sp. Leaf383]|uniref:hypothetical protein n=1 Tax=Rhizobium sp. Leaf383 TaxID=1736357 RepID=UPI000713394B|nr:hypothetical protein [Rhizobium sp. Leaf383]KQS84844.1 hypothetical protein ASG58_20340 [Rhizobium sp. Leaf383]
MPRPAKPANASGAEATREWRKAVREQRRPETDAVDTALVAALTVYRHQAEKAKSERDVLKVEGMEAMAVNFLVARGYDREQAKRRVLRRVRRFDADLLVPLVNGPSLDGRSAHKSDGAPPPGRQSK